MEEVRNQDLDMRSQTTMSFREGNTSSEDMDGRESQSVAESVDIDVNPPTKHASIDDLIKHGNNLGEDMLSKVLNVSSHVIYDKNEEIKVVAQEIPTITSEGTPNSGNIPDYLNTPDVTLSKSPQVQEQVSTQVQEQVLVPVNYDVYGFKIDPNTTNYDKIQLDTTLEAQWTSLLATWHPKKRSKKIKKLCRLGIPNSVRGQAWRKIAGIEKKYKPLLYTELTTRPANDTYEVIDKDIGRCYPEHQKFRNEQGRTQLQSVLRAFTHMHPEIGYCQGMGRLAGLLLMKMEPEESFWTFNAIIENYIPNLYLPSLVQMRVDALVFDRLINRKLPKLGRHLKANDLHSLTFTTQWFMTLYTMALPWPTVLRMWDIFLFEGEKAIFKIGLAVLECCKGK